MNASAANAASASAAAANGDLAEATGPAYAVARPLAPPFRFCPRCGAAWQADWVACPCAAAAALTSGPTVAVAGDDPARSIYSGIALYVAMLLTGLGAAFFGHLFSGDDGDGEFVATCWAEAADALLVLTWCAVSWPRLAPSLRRLPPLGWYAWALVGSIGTFLLASLCVWGLQAAGLEAESYSDSILAAGYGWPMVVLLICVQPAIIEELAFRGIIFSGMSAALGGREAVLVSSLLFMVIHLSVASFPHLLVIGLVIGFLRLRTGSLYPGVLLHFCHNLFVVIHEAAGG